MADPWRWQQIFIKVDVQFVCGPNAISKAYVVHWEVQIPSFVSSGVAVTTFGVGGGEMMTLGRCAQQLPQREMFPSGLERGAHAPCRVWRGVLSYFPRFAVGWT